MKRFLEIEKKQKGFTILELLIVMAITIVVGVLGVYGLTVFRQTSVLTQASREFLTNLETAQNRARNNTLSTVKRGNSTDPLAGKVDAYAIAFNYTGNGYNLRNCMKNATPIATTSDYDCSLIEESGLKLTSYKDVVISLSSTSPYPCQGVLFQSVTGKIMLFDSLGILKTSTTNYCDVELTYQNTNNKRTIRIDALNQRISFI